MSLFTETVLPFLTSLAAIWWVYPKVLRIAIDKDIVDNPDARKLQRVPVPVLGGASVFFGLLVGMFCTETVMPLNNLLIIFGAMGIMLCIGVLDDIIGLTPKLRFFVEIALVGGLVAVTGDSINDFHGLWGIYEIPFWAALPLTVFAGVGIINATNLIDGVDGYSSGFCIMACTLFGVMFHRLGNPDMVVLASLSVGSLIPFFFHNVFGRRSKMFIGDSGTLMMGVVLMAFVVEILASGAVHNRVDSSLGLVPFTLAVMSIPVFDTLRVMLVRICRGKSPFHPDKTHLHHLFIDLGFSHIGTTVSILLSDLFVVACWFLSWRLDASVDVQLYVVVALSLLVTFGFYPFMRRQIAHDTGIYHLMRRIGRYTHKERTGVFLRIMNFMDRCAPEDTEKSGKSVKLNDICR